MPYSRHIGFRRGTASFLLLRLSSGEPGSAADPAIRLLAFQPGSEHSEGNETGHEDRVACRETNIEPNKLCPSPHLAHRPRRATLRPPLPFYPLDRKCFHVSFWSLPLHWFLLLPSTNNPSHSIQKRCVYRLADPLLPL